MNVKPLFKLMVEKKASDLFFAPFAPAKIKIEGKIMPVNKLEMTPKMVKQAAFELMTEEQMDSFNRELEIDFALSEQGSAGFASTSFTSAATWPWYCATSPRNCRRSKSSACRSS